MYYEVHVHYEMQRYFIAHAVHVLYMSLMYTLYFEGHHNVLMYCS